MSPQTPFSYFAALIALTTASPLRTPLTPRHTGSSTMPYCFYNQGCGTICWGRPLESNCESAITATCTALISVQAGNHTQLATRIGDGKDDGDNADCVASATNGNFPPPDMNTCIQHFQMIQGCFMTTNQGYGANCVGGNINVPFCTITGGPIDGNVPTYGLGTPTQLGLTAVSYSPPGQLSSSAGDGAPLPMIGRVGAAAMAVTPAMIAASPAGAARGASGGGATIVNG